MSLVDTMRQMISNLDWYYGNSLNYLQLLQGQEEEHFLSTPLEIKFKKKKSNWQYECYSDRLNKNIIKCANYRIAGYLFSRMLNLAVSSQTQKIKIKICVLKVS